MHCFPLSEPDASPEASRFDCNCIRYKYRCDRTKRQQTAVTDLEVTTNNRDKKRRRHTVSKYSSGRRIRSHPGGSWCRACPERTRRSGPCDHGSGCTPAGPSCAGAAGDAGGRLDADPCDVPAWNDRAHRPWNCPSSSLVGVHSRYFRFPPAWTRLA